MNAKIYLTLIGAVQIFFTAADQSEASNGVSRPIRGLERDAPEVVLQLKYDGGELNKIYLTQFRKEKAVAVPAKRSLCADLCHAGLGGIACGSTCLDLVPIGLKTALYNSNETELQFGAPRTAVCPVLCENGLGQPLCSCENDKPENVDWDAVCETFCVTDKYVLYGCPACEEVTNRQMQAFTNRVLNTADGWKSWCNVQCSQGQGGAACNCDRAPFQ